MALELSGIGPNLVKYLGLHRPPKRALSWDRVAKLLGELKPMIESRSIHWEGRDWPASPDAWTTAIQVLLDMRSAGKLVTPLDNHNLLKSVIARRANTQEAKAETALEEQRRNYPDATRQQTYSGTSSTTSASSGPPPDERTRKLTEKIKGLERLYSYRPTEDLARQLEEARAELQELTQSPNSRIPS
jgi:uncharacterized Zn finger protein (UPF0148 family)